jgi:hypothetical protein
LSCEAARKIPENHSIIFKTKQPIQMRYLIIFMLLVGIFMFGKRSFHCSFMGTHGAGPVQTETRSVRDFKGVDLDISGDVEVRVSDTYSVEVQAQSNLLPLLKTEVKDGRLNIYFSENVSSSDNIKVLISGPAFDHFAVAGSGNLKVVSPIQSEKMDISIAGSGDLEMAQATLGALDCDISGSGGMEIGGTANATHAVISGSGEIDAKQLSSNELRAEIAGSGTISAHVVQVLKADIAGSGDVFYSGDPSVQMNVSGSGSVSKL